MNGIPPGTLVDGRYKVISRLGSGGMADVYLVEDQQLGRKVALKLLHHRFAEDPGFVERFRREAQSAAGLQHPNVVSVYDRGAYDDTFYIAMEYLPGRTLKQVIREDAPLDPIRAIDITIQILKAARFAHRRVVIHRDLKPHNVIVDDADHAKVTDFGIARAGASDMTETGSIMGTAQYLSPEQAQGLPVSAASDLYSIGVVLYELLTGRVPFDADAAVTIALKHVSETPTPPTALSPSVPPELEQVVLWSLNKDPADRPADADQLIAALEQARASILAGGRGQQTANMAAFGVAAAGVAAIPSTAAIAATQARTAPAVGGELPSDDGLAPLDEGVHDHDEDRGPLRWLWVLLLALLVAGAAVAAFLLTRPTTELVPTVVNQTVSVAQTEIQNAGLTPNLVYRRDNHPSGIVIAQDPLGATKVNKGSTVTLTVSSGPGSVVVPTVEGVPKQRAIQMIRRAHLSVGPTLSEFSNLIAPGSATRTDPGAGRQLPVGTAVTLFISSGQPPVAVPDVTGQSEGDARATLVARGFSVSTSTRESSNVTAGDVVSQDPIGGSRVAPNSSVSLVIASAPATTVIPDVRGGTASAATQTLQLAGFTVHVSAKEVTDRTQNGLVISQSPAGNTQAKKGSTVTILVGRFKPPPTTSTRTSTSPPSSTSTPTPTPTPTPSPPQNTP